MLDGVQHSCAAAGCQCCGAAKRVAPLPAAGHAVQPWRDVGRDLGGIAPQSQRQFPLLPWRIGVLDLGFFHVKPYEKFNC